VKTSLCVCEIHIKHAKEDLVEHIKELRARQTYDSIVELLGRAPLEEHDICSLRESQDSKFEASDHEMGGISSMFCWTSVTSDLAVLDHLFQL
jgi:hypothetical protein